MASSLRFVSLLLSKRLITRYIVYIHIPKVNGVDKGTLCGKTTAKLGKVDIGQAERMELERLRVEVAQLRLNAHLRN